MSQARLPVEDERLTELVNGVLADIDPIVDEAIAEILRQLPDYVGEDGVPAHELRESVRSNLDLLLRALRDHRDPDPDEVTLRSRVGQRRALQGMDIESVVRAYHVGYGAMWESLVQSVPPGEVALVRLLLANTALVWRWVHAISEAIHETYRRTLWQREADLVGARLRLVESVLHERVLGEHVALLARTAGFDSESDFTGLTVALTTIEGSEARRLQEVLGALVGVHACVARGPNLVVLTQGGDIEAVAGATADVHPRVVIGVGVSRPGLHGAGASIRDAELAAAIASSPGAHRFEDEWLWATLNRSRDSLGVLLEPGVAVARDHGHLAETVLAFAESSFSVTDAARILSVHANTVAYRLDRWLALTGWDPRTFPGLTRSMAALRLEPSTHAEPPTSPDPEAPDRRR